MKKVLAALAAISLLLFGLSLLKLQQLGNSFALTAEKDTATLLPRAEEKKASFKNKRENNLLPSKANEPDRTLNSQLTLNLALRYRFDDIIHQHQISGKSLENLLLALTTRLNLTPNAGENLQALFQRYRQYLSAMSVLKANVPAVDRVIDLIESRLFLQQVYDLQSQYFSELEIRAFFAHEKNYNRQTLERVAIRQDTSLDKEQRQMLIEHQLSQLEPEELAPLQPTLTARKITRLLTGEREQDLTLAPEVSAKIRVTREKKRLWQQKVKSYQQKIAAMGHRDNDGYSLELENYRLQHFSDNELKRLKVFLKHPELLTTP
ncbi:lipase secretion chaperone [Thalassomonas actiniarum]|uniref:Lipase chaperone n=1 Tax=Thalassomonas actiniarum TaxID=485447 RepID=A0AAE9YS34_9GAMM|nr:lipase secretion chaperone [Thalassomonas actiniarum]WDE00206.1 lipase chaperone [Thalassomonas actiniarum]